MYICLGKETGEACVEGVGDRYAQETLYISIKISTNTSLTPSSNVESAFFVPLKIMPIISSILHIHLKMAGNSFELCRNKSKIFKRRY